MKTGRIWRHGVWALCVLAVASGAAWAQNQPGSGQPSPPPAAPETQDSKPPEEPQKDEPHKDENVAEQAADATKKLGETTLSKLTDWENGWLTGPYVGKERNLVSVTSRERWDIYLQQTLTTPSAYIKRMIVAGFDQWRDSPPQWPEGWNGYGERFASREGQFIAANSLANLGNAALRYEPRYDQCKCSGFRLRTRHAILRNFLTYDRYEEKLHPQWALYGGAFGGGVIANSWKPHPRNALAEGGWAVLGQAGYGSLLNFFTEFAGDINRKLGARRQARSGRQSPEK